MSVALRAVSMWLSLPFLQRLEAFLSLLSLHQQQLATAAAAAAAEARCVPSFDSYSPDTCMLKRKFSIKWLRSECEMLVFVLLACSPSFFTWCTLQRRLTAVLEDVSALDSSLSLCCQGTQLLGKCMREMYEGVWCPFRSVGTGLPVRDTGDSKYHAETALDAILDDLQVCWHVLCSHVLCSRARPPSQPVHSDA